VLLAAAASRPTLLVWRRGLEWPVPEAGRYVVLAALDLVEIDREQGLGTYAETNLWMRHL
jgi:hypothetical protein